MDVRRWAPLAAVAAVLAVAGLGYGLSVLLPGERAVEDPAVVTLGEPAAGRQWVTWRNVAVQVPDSWASFGWEPGEDWCADFGGDGPFEPGPYVSYRSGLEMTLAIGCPPRDADVPEAFGPAPEHLWRTHLGFGLDTGKPDTTATYDGWTITRRTVGDVELRLLTDDVEATDDVLGSAQTFTRDHHGCDITSPVDDEQFVRPDAFDLSEVDAVDSISVCQYDRAQELPGATLMGSHRITGQAASDLLAALKVAPEGGGPDRPETCTHDAFGDTALAIRLNGPDGVHDLHAYYDHCFGNGIDDGTTRRELTRDSCAPLFVEPVRLFHASGGIFGVCATTG